MLFRHVALGALAIAVLAAPVHANGRMPGATELAIAKNDAQHFIARATFGLVQSFDGGESWQWICEQAINVSGESDPPLAVTEDGTLILLPTTGGTLISRDRGCSWAPAPELEDSKAVDLTVDPTDPSHVLLVTSTIDTIDDAGLIAFSNVVFETHDNAQSWQVAGTLPADFEIETIEVAPSDPQRIYLSGTASESPLIGVIQRSDDGGASWTRTMLDLPPTSGSLFVSAVHPTDPDRLWVRVPAQGDRFGIFPASLLMSDDAGGSFAMLGATTQGMLGLALSPDGETLAYGGPADGLLVGPSDGSAPHEKVSELRVRCLRWNERGLYACGLEPQDPFSVGLSTDQGASFEPVYAMKNTCPQECPKSASFEAKCALPWTGIGMRIAAEAEGCAVQWPAADAGMRDAGTLRDAGSDAATVDASAPEVDAMVTAPTKASESGCACHAVGGSRRHGGLLAPCALLGALLFALRRRRAVMVLSALALIACADDAPPSDEPDNGPEVDATMFVACDETIPELEAGLTVEGTEGNLEARLIDASAFPARKYKNTWQLRLAQVGGDAEGDVMVTKVEAFMPVHDHYGRPPASFEVRQEPEQIDAELHFHMRGPWEVRIQARSASAGDDIIVIETCVTE